MISICWLAHQAATKRPTPAAERVAALSIPTDTDGPGSKLTIIVTTMVARPVTMPAAATVTAGQAIRFAYLGPYWFGQLKFEVRSHFDKLNANGLKDALNMSFDHSTGSGLRTNGKFLIPFVVSPEPVEGSNHERNRVIQSILKHVEVPDHSSGHG
ncbi:MAG: hypothetical protein ACSLE5_14525 [Porticoccaceae bacterium]